MKYQDVIYNFKLMINIWVNPNSIGIYVCIYTEIKLILDWIFPEI